MLTITRRLEWDAAHRVLRHESKCRTLHGHRYRAELVVTAPELNSLGMVIDFSVLKRVVGGWIDQHWDHSTLVNVDDTDLIAFCQSQHDKDPKQKVPYIFSGEPTAELIAVQLHSVAANLLADHEITVVSVCLWETPNCMARFSYDRS